MMMTSTIILFAILVALQAGDWISSSLAARTAGAYEANPIMANAETAAIQAIITANGW